MKLSLISLSLLPLLSAATPAPATVKGTPFTATFDDIPGSSDPLGTILTAAAPELIKVPDGYRNLAWKAFDVFNNIVSTIPANSGTQVAATFFGTELLQSSTANITATYPNSKTKYFDLTSLYLGLVVASQTSAKPIKGTVTFTGHKAAGGDVVKRYTFSGGNKFELVSFGDSFKGVSWVSADLGGLVPTVLDVALIDTVKGVTYA